MTKETNIDELYRWAYDDEALLSEQDEDLLVVPLAGPEWYSVLIPLANDPRCPKADYILSCMDFATMFQTLRGDERYFNNQEKAIELASKSSSQNVRDWAQLLGRRIKYKRGCGPVDKELALKMADDLLNGISRNAEISIVSETEKEWTVRLSVQPLQQHQEFLDIDKQTGLFRFRR